LLYLTSKTQHALWTLLPAAYLGYLVLQWRTRLLRIIGTATTILLIVGGALELLTADTGNRAQALFNKLFYQIGTAGPQGPGDLREMGVRAEELKYIGTHSFAPGTPASNIQWVEEFYSRTGYRRLLGWYLHHPKRAAGMLWHTLSIDSTEM